MFGLSFWKVLLLAAVIAAVYLGFRWFERAQQEKNRIADRRAPAGSGTGAGASANARRDATTHDLVACRVCGAFVAEGSARACNRPSCPYPR